MARHSLFEPLIPHQHRRMYIKGYSDGGSLDSGFLVMPDVNNVIGYDLAQQALDLQDNNNEFKKGGKIHIKKSHEGLFTQAAKRAGMGVQQYASHVLNDPHASATMKKRANFARNAAKWKHSLGGSLYEIGGVMQSNGTNFPTGITEINNGGTHEQNPYEGVQMGVDGEGTPNLVEEGEVVWNNYVFSNRILVPAEVKKALGLGTAKMTFAEAAKKLSKGIKERPNDPIEADALETNMSRLAQAQEQIRQQMQQEEDMKAAREMQYMQQLGMAAYGGNLFSGGGGYTAIGKTMANNTRQQASRDVPERMSNFFNALYDYFTGKTHLSGYAHHNGQTFIDNIKYLHSLKEGQKQKPQTTQQNKKSSTITGQNKKSSTTQKPSNQLQEVVVTAQRPSNKQTTQSSSKPTSNNSTSTKQTSSNKQTNGYVIPEVTIVGQRPKNKQVEVQQTPQLPVFRMSPNDWIPNVDDTENIVAIQPQLPRITAEEAMDMIPAQDTDYLMDLNPYDNTSIEAERQINKYNKKPVYGGLFRRKNKFPEGGPFDLQSLNDLLANKKEPYSFEPSQALALRMQNMNKTRSSNDNDNDVDNDSNTNPLTYLRFAPIIDSGVATLTDMFGLSNKYDYTNTNITKNLAGNILSSYNPIRTRPISDYLTYNSLDRDYMANKISASATAARRTAMNNNAANQAARNALLGSLNYSSLLSLGDALMNMDAKNFERQKEVAAHNANINEFNAQQAAAADTANAQNKNYLLGLYNTDMDAALKMKQDMEDAINAAKAANRNALITNLGGLGKETVQGEWIKNHPALDYYFNLITGNASYKPDVSAFGGMLTRRKRKNCRRR